jgi:hypothetical protein
LRGFAIRARRRPAESRSGWQAASQVRAPRLGSMRSLTARLRRIAQTVRDVAFQRNSSEARFLSQARDHLVLDQISGTRRCSCRPPRSNRRPSTGNCAGPAGSAEIGKDRARERAVGKSMPSMTMRSAPNHGRKRPKPTSQATRLPHPASLFSGRLRGAEGVASGAQAVVATGRRQGSPPRHPREARRNADG